MPPVDANRLLGSVSPASRARLLSQAEAVDLPVLTVLYEAGVAPEYAFFLTSGFGLQVITLPERASAEVGLIGPEGVVGHLALLGPGTATSRCFMQANGTGVRVPMDFLRRMFLDSEDVRERVLAFTQAHAVASAYLAACNKLHDTESRLARWLLMVRDRLGTDMLPLTQDFWRRC